MTQAAKTDSPKLTKRLARAHRILDAAVELVLRWGYDKTTLDDIAQKAEVAKGTLYLHWKTREALFEALVKREGVAMGEDFVRRVEADPAGATLRGLYKHSALAVIQRPLIKALLLGDREVLGKLANNKHATPAYADSLAGYEAYIGFLRQHKLVRTDLSIKEQVYMVSAIFIGFFLVAPLMPNDLRLPDEQVAELIGETVHRTLESGRTVSARELKTISAAFKPYLNHVMATTEKQFQTELAESA